MHQPIESTFFQGDISDATCSREEEAIDLTDEEVEHLKEQLQRKHGLQSLRRDRSQQ